MAPELDDVGLAEVLWLAAVRDGRTAEARPAAPAPSADSSGGDDASSGRDPSARPPSRDPKTPGPDTGPAHGEREGRPRAGDREFYENIASPTPAIRGKAVSVPRSTALPRALELGRALRPVKRAWAPGPRRVLDVEATARDYARSGELLPVLRARDERWLDLTLVVDRSASMAVWGEVAAEFAGVLRRLGAFKRVRVWDLTMGPEGRPRLGPSGTLDSPGRQTASPPTGPRNQILLFSDCSADGWYQDPVWQLLHTWGAAVPTALINPLPARLWAFTALDLPAVRVTSPGTPTARNTRLEYRRPWHLRIGPEATAQLTPLPVVMLTPYALESWTRVLMSAGTVGGADLAGCDAVLIPATGRFADDEEPADEDREDGGWSEERTGRESVEHFLANASAPAAGLAVMLAPYTSLTMPLLHLVQQTMVPEATVAEVAEVVVSGLFTTTARTGEAPVLHPREGIQAALEDLLDADDAWQMYDTLSRYIATHAGSPAELAAVVRDPAGAVGLPAELRPFAAATADTLRVLDALPPADMFEEAEAADRLPTVRDAGTARGLGKLIAFESHVSGIGMTTAAVNVAMLLAADGKRVLYVDGDPRPAMVDHLLGPLISGDWVFPNGGSLRCDGGTTPRGVPSQELLRQYDYVLIDGFPGFPDFREDGVSTPDAIVVCYPLRDHATAALSVRYAASGLRVLPVPMQEIEIPWRALPAADGGSVPEVFQRTLMLGAYKPLAEWILDTPLSTAPERSDALQTLIRKRYTEYRRLGDQIHIAYDGVDRMWAEWAAAIVGTAVSDVRLQPVHRWQASDVPENSRWLLIESESFHAGRGPAIVGDIGALGARCWTLTVSAHTPTTLGIREVDVSDMDTEQAQEALLLMVGGGAARPEVPSRRWGRDPRRLPDTTRVPARNSDFTGRDSFLEQLRNELTSELTQHICIGGPPGSGKTQIAVEYAHRFGADYDIITWAEPAEEDSRQRHSNVNSPFNRLIVVDVVGDHLPALDLNAGSHVIYTSRSRLSDTHVRFLELDVFTRAESIDLLRRLVPDTEVEDAYQVAEYLGDLPAAIATVGAWAADTGTPLLHYLRRLKAESSLASASLPPADYPMPFDAMWEQTVQDLRSESPGAARLLEILAVAAPAAVSMEFLTAPSVSVALVPTDKGSSAAFNYLGILIYRFLVRSSDEGYTVHRLLQDFVIRHMSEEDRTDTRALIHSALTDLRPAPPDVEDPANWPAYSRIWSHLVPSGAVSDSRTWPLCLDRMRYLRVRGRYAAAREFGEWVVECWSEEARQSVLPGPELEAALLQARGELAELACREGRFQDAHNIAPNILPELHPFRHVAPLPLVQAVVGRAAALRGLGDPVGALDELESTLSEHGAGTVSTDTAILGAMHDRAVALRLLGRLDAARALDERVLNARRSTLGPRHPTTLRSQAALARDHRLSGRFRSSATMLEEAYGRLRVAVGDDHPETVRAATSYAVSLRLGGRVEEALRLSELTYTRCAESHGSANPDTLTCRLNLAADLSATGDRERALEEATRTLDQVRVVFGPWHQFTVACLNNQAIYYRRIGRADRARETAEFTHGLSSEHLGADHPTTLATTVTVANALAEQQLWKRVRQLEDQLRVRISRVLGLRHPYSLALASNIAGTASRPDAEELHGAAVDLLTEVLGPSDPLTVSARQRKRIDLELEMEPI